MGVLDGRRAVVTGGASGLGRSIAVALSWAGADVAVIDREHDPQAVMREIQASGRVARNYRYDLSRAPQIGELVDLIAQDLGGLDLVVNNAAVTRRTDPQEDSFAKALDDFSAMVDTNLRSYFLVGRAAVPHLVAAGGGDIINVTTDHIHTCGYPIRVSHDDAQECPWSDSPPRAPIGGIGNYDVYDATKWGIKGLTLNWARALHGSGVRVNSFGMGATDTPMVRALLGQAPSYAMNPKSVAEVLVELLAEGPNGRTGDSVELWAGHPLHLPPPSLDATIVAAQLSAI